MTEDLLLIQNDGKTLYLGPPKEFKAESLPKYLPPYTVTRINGCDSKTCNEVFIRQGSAELADLKRGGVNWHSQTRFNLDSAVIDALKKLAEHKIEAEK